MELEPPPELKDVAPLAEAAPPRGRLERVFGRAVVRPEAGGVRDLPGLAAAPGFFAQALAAVFSYRFSFVALVLLPALAAAVYLVALASDQYAAEARFAVRAAQFDSAKSSSDGPKTALSAGGGIPSMASQDAYVIASYIRSAAVFADLPASLDPRVIYSRPEADFWARLPAKASLETLADYWRSMVTTYVDGPSGVVTVSVRAFRPDDARDLAAAVVAASEKLVNAMSARARRDAMRDAEAEVKRTEAMVSESLADERAYRNRSGWTDPAAQATAVSTLLMQAMAERIRLQNDYFVDSRAMSPEAPTLVTLKSHIDALDGQIARLKDQLTSAAGDKGAVSASIAEFETLEIKRIFAEKLYTLSQEALERARQRAERQMVYISVFAPPLTPEEARYPERLSLSAIIFISLLAVWGIGAMTVATVADHTI
ncbi:capsular polysaccharide transport system permease protein [Roseiarcus fermentans]|uniref:Capsular polysaccharide transport system permease protein n=1 Tax=Roseiarcus fermentans TaxID=1473586 RepID=A0A366EQD9_9HYPH|nr:capsule biosynthesis protein [Roseiarcus fermentans]RBP04632.1 capsular polysaccharide transport system permease protein [Roseiarcus fermentans]